MPPGARKRKAAKRKKEQEEKEKAMGSIPDPPLSPTDDPLPSPSVPPQPQGSDDRKEETESGELETPFATPLSQVKEEEGEGVPGSSECIAVGLVTESLENEVRVQGMAAAAEEDGLPAPKDEFGVEIIRSEKGEPCDAEGAEESVIHVEQSVVASEEVKRGKESLAETPKEASAATDPAPSHESEVKVVPLPEEDAVEEEPHVSGEASQGTGRAEMVPTPEVVSRDLQVVHRPRWWNCCGLLEVLVRSER